MACQKESQTANKFWAVYLEGIEFKKVAAAQSFVCASKQTYEFFILQSQQ